MNFLKALFSEDKSASMMRVISLLCCLTAIAVAFLGMSKDKIDYSGITMLVSAFLGSGISGKIIQKKIEVKDQQP